MKLENKKTTKTKQKQKAFFLTCLNNSSSPNYKVPRNSIISFFGHQPIDPVQNVKRSVESHGSNVIASDVFNFSSSTNQKQLRQNGQRLKINACSPQRINHAVHVRLWRHNSQQRCRSQNEGQNERIILLVISLKKSFFFFFFFFFLKKKTRERTKQNNFSTLL